MPNPGNLTTAVPIASIHVADDSNGRAFLDPRRVAELADALAHEPLLHPITLRRTVTGLHLIAGRHRLAAFKKLGRDTIPALVLDCDDSTEATLRLCENLQRVTLSPVEQAHQLAALVALNDQGVEPVAIRLARSIDWILDRLEILTWPEELAQAVHAKRIPLAAAKLLARISPPELRAQRIADASNHGCSAATARLWLQHQHADQPIQETTSKFSSQEAIYQTETTVRVICAGCAELKPIEETQLMRWCNGCLSTIQEAQEPYRGRTPEHDQPIYNPPPPMPRQGT